MHLTPSHFLCNQKAPKIPEKCRKQPWKWFCCLSESPLLALITCDIPALVLSPNPPAFSPPSALLTGRSGTSDAWNQERLSAAVEMPLVFQSVLATE